MTAIYVPAARRAPTSIYKRKVAVRILSKAKKAARRPQIASGSLQMAICRLQLAFGGLPPSMVAGRRFVFCDFGGLTYDDLPFAIFVKVC